MNSADPVADPLTPDQSTAQVVDAAREIVAAVGLPVVEAVAWHASCNDQGEAPFQGAMRIAYPLAPSLDASDAEIATMVGTLQSGGWRADPGFRTHGTALSKNGVTVVFGPQNVSNPTRNVELFGECRDVTTSKGADHPRPVTLQELQ